MEKINFLSIGELLTRDQMKRVLGGKFATTPYTCICDSSDFTSICNYNLPTDGDGYVSESSIDAAENDCCYGGGGTCAPSGS